MADFASTALAAAARDAAHHPRGRLLRRAGAAGSPIDSSGDDADGFTGPASEPRPRSATVAPWLHRPAAGFDEGQRCARTRRGPRSRSRSTMPFAEHGRWP